MEFIKEAGVSPQKSMDIKNDKITIKPLRDKDVGHPYLPLYDVVSSG